MCFTFIQNCKRNRLQTSHRQLLKFLNKNRNLKHLLSVLNAYIVEMQFVHLWQFWGKSYSTYDLRQLMGLMTYVKSALYQDNPAANI